MKNRVAFVSIIFILTMGAALAQPLWLRYSAISPDGSQVAFSYKGDIYLVSSSGGVASPLTLDASYEFMPVWSKDGKSLAFASDRYGNFDVYVAPINGGDLKRLTHHSSDDFPHTFTNDNQSVVFNSWRVDLPKYAQFPNGRMPELYSIPVSGGRPVTVLTTPSEEVVYNKAGNKIYYQDRKGYEDPFRKHHQSSIARDLWVYDMSAKTHTQLTTFGGEDRDPILSADEKSLYYLSEESGNFNLHKMDLSKPGTSTQLTKFTRHPVRFLTMSNNGVLCFSFDGELYTMKEGETPKKLNVEIRSIRQNLEREIVPISSGITEMEIAPSGKEFVFVKRGEVFVASVDGGTTKRITNTPEQERSVSFSPDGRSIIYAGERDGSWNIYQSKIQDDKEPYFFASTIVTETALVKSPKQEFQPAYSPDGKKVAYLSDRTELMVIDLASKKTEVVLPADRNYSYSDGDQFFSWSPDSKWIASGMLRPKQWIGELGVINVATKEVRNISNSGYEDNVPKWSADGSMIYWFSDRDGMKNHGSWGSENDVYAVLLTQEAYDNFKLSKEDKELADEAKKDDKKEDAGKDDKKKGDADEKKEEIKPVVIDFNDIKKRKVRLTQHSSRLGDALVAKDGEKLYYLARFEEGADLWVTDLRKNETKLLTKLGANGAGMLLDKEGKNIFIIADGRVSKVDAESGKKEGLNFNGEMELKKQAEHAYMFNHMWQQVKDKFYVKDLHNVDWEGYKKDYARFLPHINNNHDFAEMMSELLGELNASHTGCRYRFGESTSDATSSLGLLFDESHTGTGLKIAEVIKDGPCDKAGMSIAAGDILEKLDGVTLAANVNQFEVMNRKNDQNVRLGILKAGGTRMDVVVKPITRGAEYNLLYERWVANRKKEVAEASGGKVGYVHVRGMNNPSFRTVYEEVLGENYDKESIIVDTRSNGGGWLHDDLATFLNGKAYIQFYPRGQNLGNEPQFKWTKPSVVLVGESNYSDAHMFPYTYSALGVGTTVGMPVPGTGTAVWWEGQIDPSLVFGIPQVGMIDVDGDYLENKQYEPDVKVPNTYEMLTQGKDEQLLKAVEILTKDKTSKPEGTKLEGVEGKN
jgi:Tol biopolymer transport system component/C-terminal processing protease CtpA/Prc